MAKTPLECLLFFLKNKTLVEGFITRYNNYINKIIQSNVIEYQSGEWKDFADL